MDIHTIIQELQQKNILHSKPIGHNQLSGGTTSELILLECTDGQKIVIKQNEPQTIESEGKFLFSYKEVNLLPHLLFVEPSNRYLVYSFIEGSTQFSRENKKGMLSALVNGLINNYEIVDHPPGWGWEVYPARTWKDFLLNEIFNAKEVLKSNLNEDEFRFVRNLVETSKEDSSAFKPFLLHGDCGVHNFIFKEEQLYGVIDPTPIIGDPMFDLIYAFCSSPDQLKIETIDYAVSQLNIKGYQVSPFLYEDIVIGLYLRLRNCNLHHPADLPDYLKAWQYWKDILNS